MDILEIVSNRIDGSWIEVLRFMCADAVAWRVCHPAYCTLRADLQNMMDWRFEAEIEQMSIVESELEQQYEIEEIMSNLDDWMYDYD